MVFPHQMPDIWKLVCKTFTDSGFGFAKIQLDIMKNFVDKHPSWRDQVCTSMSKWKNSTTAGAGGGGGGGGAASCWINSRVDFALLFVFPVPGRGGRCAGWGDVPPGPVIQHSQYQPLHLIGTRDQEGARLVAVNTLSSRSMEVLAIMTLFIFKRIILIFEIKSNISFTDKNNINFVLY